MAHVTSFIVDYSKHGLVQADMVDHVTLRLPGLPAGKFPDVLVTHRGGSADPLWFDFTYPDGTAPMTETLAPMVDNSFVLLPGGTYRIHPGYKVDQVAVTSTGLTAWSVMAMW